LVAIAVVLPLALPWVDGNFGSCLFNCTGLYSEIYINLMSLELCT